jgi:hypothetical protein
MRAVDALAVGGVVPDSILDADDTPLWDRSCPKCGGARTFPNLRGGDW